MEKNAIYLTGRGVDAIGLNRYPDSSRFIPDEKARALSYSIHRKNSSVDCVGIYVNEPVETIRDEVRDLDLDIVQLHGNEDPDEVEELSGTVRVIKAFSVGPDFSSVVFEQYDPWAFLLDGHALGQFGGTGNTAPWKIIQPWTRDHKIILAGGLNPENLEVAARTAKPWGLDINSGVEGEEGRKDPGKLRRLLDVYESLEESTE